MRKNWFFRSAIGVIILTLIGLVVAFWLLKAPIISSYLSKKMGVNVSIGNISLGKSETIIRDFRINNPPGSKTRTAFSSKAIDIFYDFKALRSDPSVIRSVRADDSFLSIELYDLTGSQNNWSRIMSNVSRKQRKKEGETIIRSLVFNDLTVQIRGQGLLEEWKTVKRIPRIEFRNISSKKGFPTDVLIRELFKEADLMKYLQDILQPESLFDKLFKTSKVESPQKKTTPLKIQEANRDSAEKRSL